MKEQIRLALFLMVMSVIAATALSVTYMLTQPRIEAYKQGALLTSLSGCIPGAVKIETAKIEASPAFKGYDGKGNVCGYALRVSPKGYGGPIDMVVGIGPDGKVTGVNIINMTETPGLGSQAKEKKFLDQFTGRKVSDKLKAKQDIDAISGATITTQAVSDGVKEALVLFGKLRK